mgnify:CR=1 FL=1
MTPQYQFNLGQADPLLSIAQNNPEGYISVIEQELLMLNIMIMLDYILNGSVILIRMN